MRAVAYIRVSDLSQVDGNSLDAQERLFKELCKSRDWEQGRIYREEGKSAHTDSISKRPVFRQLLDDSRDNQFDIVVVHTLDRWSRNTRIALESLAMMAKHNVALVSITENIDYSTAQGKLMTTMLAGFAEYFSDSLSTHIKKGLGERAHQGRHLGGIPFGFQSCWEGPKGSRQLSCEPEHPGGVHPVALEADAIRELFRRYSSGATTLSQLAGWMNDQGFRTRNMHAGGPSLFTTASVRVILHNPFYCGKIRHGDQVLTGAQDAFVSQELFDLVQSTMRRNSSRSETLQPRPEREYLLKGLVKCAHCGMSLWAQTLTSGSRLYREQARTRSHMDCPGDSKSIRCEIPDEQIGRIVGAVVLPDAWMDRVLAKIQLGGEVERVNEERSRTEARLKRLGEVYLDGLKTREDYLRDKKGLEDTLSGLVVPGVDAAQEAGKLLENLPSLWAEANLNERRKLLLAMLEAVYVDTI